MKKINNECVRKKFKYRRKLYNHPAMFMFAGEKINLRERGGGNDGNAQYIPLLGNEPSRKHFI